MALAASQILRSQRNHREGRSPTDRWNPGLRCLVRDYPALFTGEQDQEAHYLPALSPFRRSVVTKLFLRFCGNLLPAASSHWRGSYPLELAEKSRQYYLRKWGSQVAPCWDETMRAGLKPLRSNCVLCDSASSLSPWGCNGVCMRVCARVRAPAAPPR